MCLAIFDLDNTLLAGDSDYLWGSFLCEENLVDPIEFSRANDKFYSDYAEGTLNISAYLEFALRPLADIPMSQLEELRLKFLSEKINPIVLGKARELITKHVNRGDHPIIVTATNDFVTRPISTLLGVSDLLACVAEIKNGEYTGACIGTPTFKEGKVIRLKEWITANQKTLEGAWFYTDSHNDLPLLQIVDNPVAVDPDALLRDVAIERGWTILSLR